MKSKFKTVVINLKRSTERREVMRIKIDSLGIEYEFFDAIDYKSNDFDNFSKYNKEARESYWGRGLSLGEIGCFASHYALWQRSVDEDIPLLIMEDDIEFSSLFKEAYDNLEKQSDRYDYVRLARISKRRSANVEKISQNLNIVRYLQGVRGTQCYFLTPKGARKLLDKADEWIIAVDVFLDMSWIHGLPCYSFKPTVVSPIATDSIIGARRDGIVSNKKKFKREFLRFYFQLRQLTFNMKMLIQKR